MVAEVEVVKNKGGRPRKEPTYTRGIRFNELLRDFFNNTENANNFIIQATMNTPEFKEFLKHRKEQENAPKLF